MSDSDIREKLDELPSELADKIREKLTEIDQLRDAAEAFADGYVGKVRIQFGLTGLGVGLAAGAAAGYFVAKRRLTTKYGQIADDEIAEMRKHYQAKAVAAEAQAQKLSPVKDIVSNRGYSVPADGPPMAVQPPAGVIENDDDEEMGADEDTPDIEKFAPQTRNVFQEVPPVDHEWDYHEETRKRSPDTPYVIHYDERHEIEYQEVTLTYYAGDDVLCNERDEVVDPDDRDRLIGEKNLDRFGHGSNDPSIVYVRNDRLELIYELVKSPHSFAEEVHGFSHEAYDRGNIERMRTRERDEQED